jgi:hypothetical protein
MTPQISLRLYTQNGIALVETNAEITRSWVLNNTGRAEFTLASGDVAYQERAIRYGNLVLIQSDSLPDWVGVIDTPRYFSYGRVKVTAYTADWIFSFRRGDSPAAFAATPPAIFASLVGVCNAAASGSTMFQLGQIGSGHGTVSEKIDFSILLDETRRIANGYGYEFDVSGYLKNNQLILQANFKLPTTAVRQDVVLDSRNCELVDNMIMEQGTIINDLVGYGSGATWYSKNRDREVKRTSVGLFGPRMGNTSFPNSSDSAVAAKTKQQVAMTQFPTKTFQLNIPNVNNEWSKLRMGDIVPLMLAGIGFTGSTPGTNTLVKIVGQAVNENQGKMSLVVSEMING